MRNERGSASLELTLMTPVLLVLLLLVVAGGRLTVARGDLDSAARDGARAASLARSPQQAHVDAVAAIDAAMDAGNIRCDNPAYDVSVGNFMPGDLVSVSVRCDVSYADLTLLPLPASRTLTADFDEVVDTFRQARPS
jgi:Flp pilus assembly protein TadG